MRCCFPKNNPPSIHEIPQTSADPPLLSKTFNAIAKKYNAKAKMAIIRIHELHYPETTSDQHGELRVHDQLAGDGITV
jgi:hypothetical protein